MASLKQCIAPNVLTIASTWKTAIKGVKCPNSFFSRIVGTYENTAVTYPWVSTVTYPYLLDTAFVHHSTATPNPLSHSRPGVNKVQRFSRVEPRGRAREWAILGVHPLSWLLSRNRLEEVCGTLTKGTFCSRLLLSNQDKGCTPGVAHSLPLPPGFCSTCQVFSSSGAKV